MEQKIMREELVQAMAVAYTEHAETRKVALKVEQLGYRVEIDPNALRGSIMFVALPHRTLSESDKEASVEHALAKQWTDDMNFVVDAVLGSALSELQEKIRAAGYEPRIEVSARLSLVKEGNPIAIDDVEDPPKVLKSIGKPN